MGRLSPARLVLVAVVVGAWSSGCTDTEPEPAAEQPFRDVTASLGIDAVHHFKTDFCDFADRTTTPGVCMFDYDGDGALDLYSTDRSPEPNRLYRNQGGTFEDVTDASGAGVTTDSQGCLAFDYDADGDSDLLVTNLGEDQLLRNDGGTFVDVTEEAGIVSDGLGASATAGDIDGDGDLDLVIGRFLDMESCENECNSKTFDCAGYRTLVFINDGGTFTEVGEERGIVAEEQTLAPLLVDFDLDGDLDLFIGNDSGIVFDDHLYLNDGTGHFVDDDEIGIRHSGSDTMGVAVGDYDDNGVMDLLITDFANKPTRLFTCESGPKCSLGAMTLDSAQYVNWGIGLLDFDGDADLDVFQVSGSVFTENSSGTVDPASPNQLFYNEGNGRFRLHEALEGDPIGAKAISRGAAFGDLDDDGDVDIVVANAGGQHQVLLNDVFVGHYLTVSLDSQSAGARVVVESGDRKMTQHVLIGGSYLGSSDPRLHFGLGDATTAKVTVIWLDGTEATLDDVAADAILEVPRP